MNYFHFEQNKDMAIQIWNDSQFDLSDVVLSLTDNNIFIGMKIYAVFCRPEVLNIMQYFICDFNKMKQDLGIVGDYVEREGNIFSKNFNPKRNINSLILSVDDMNKRAKYVYKNIMLDLENIAKTTKNKDIN